MSADSAAHWEHLVHWARSPDPPQPEKSLLFMALGVFTRRADVESARARGFDFVVSPVDAVGAENASRVMGMVDTTGIETTDQFINLLVQVANAYCRRVKHLVFSPPPCLLADKFELKEKLQLLDSRCTYTFIIPLMNDQFYWEFWSYVLNGTVSCALYFVDGHDVSRPMLERYSTLPVNYLEINAKAVPPDKYIRVFSMPSPPSIVLTNGETNPEISQLLRCPPCCDIIIDPLQPLGDNLDPSVYAQFETDTKKYSQYEKAIKLALNAVDAKRVLVAGPGRGPLVQIVGKMSRTKITAVEKNPQCIGILKERNTREWLDRVEIVHKDVRQMGGKWDLVVSEMLGSFGCNELSPEVLNGFSSTVIPASYTSYIRPIYSPMVPPQYFVPFLARLSVFYSIADPLPCWTFCHPADNSMQRTAILKFVPMWDEYINAFEGTFCAVLFQNILISNQQETSDYVPSWFPMIFPVEKTRLEKDTQYTVEFERRASSQNVWYEWSFLGKRYNQDGESYTVTKIARDEISIPETNQ